jgi:hypothetical protein
MNLCDSLAQRGICASACRGRALEPRVITAGGDTEHAADGGDPMHGLVSPYEFERRDGVVPVS